MEVPESVRSALADDAVEATVDLGGNDALFVTPSRTIVYRSEGLLSDETVEEYPHDAEGIRVSEGRRKAKLVLDYGLDGERNLSIPAKRLDETFHHLFGGVLRATGVVEPDEDVIETFRFSELTLAITAARVVKHVGTVAWDEDHETYPYEEVADLSVEAGSVATSIVLTLGDRQERFKAPNESVRAVREGLESALLSYHDVESVEELQVRAEAEQEAAAAAAETAEPDAGAGEGMSFGDGPDPLSADPAGETGDFEPAESASEAVDRTDAGSSEAAEPTAHVDAETGTDASGEVGADANRGADAEATTAADADASADAAESATPRNEDEAAGEGQADDAIDGADGPTEDAFEESGFESAGPIDGEDVSAELDALREAIEAQNEELQRQRETIEQLVEELRRGR